ncbi:methylamine dehydrogenase light chain [Thermomicrobium sp.]|uniref:methylamine dehydrogenase light chain n=1 Tax=Thermomicrobium sp. TaxID=1969469 RepID=UPI001B20473C|nr:hypothetical protein [Thermomicrobium sp.]MBO9386740.1 hypothetical protein [Thermomicrobium sp.]
MTVRTRRTLVRTVTGTLLALASWWIRPSAAPGQLSCSDWRFCGLCGCRCTCRGGSDTACPSGSTPGRAWWSCCRDASGRLWLVQYRDCCRPLRTGESKCPNPFDGCPSSCACARNCPQPHWCSSGQCAVCTQTLVEARC